MKIIAQKYKDGSLTLLDVPVPATKPGGLLVRSTFSVISAGTEMMKVAEGKLNLIGKARARPDQVKQVLQTVAQQGIAATYQKVSSRLDSYTALGYSLAGVVEDVGRDVTGFRVGQRVACGGNQFALHAELNWVPVNLCVPIPDDVTDEHAAFATIGAVAMQGFRQSELKLDESAVVIGLGLLGQILVRILRAGGISVFGIDVDASRCRMAEDGGALGAGVPGSDGFATFTDLIRRATNGAGVDCVFITAGGKSNGPVEMAAELTRDRGRVVDVGKCSLDLPWNAYYEKELDFRFSRSYGPGRYDPLYEEQGIDYPIGYVRWTEKRNMASFLQLIERKRLDISSIVSSIYNFSEAVTVYESMNAGTLSGLGILFSYPQNPARDRVIEHRQAALASPALARARSKIRVGIIGCGNYASSMLLPHLKNHEKVELVEVATTSALSAANAQAKFGFARMSTDAERVIADPDIDTVMILTPHGNHAAYASKALRAGKTVFVEKPLAITPEQLQQVVLAAAESGNNRLCVGFNRRFAPMLQALKAKFSHVSGPQFFQYRVNAGAVDAKSWYADRSNQGGRFVGEGGHFIDTASWWLGADPVSVSAMSAKGDADNVAVTLTYSDGSVATVSYMTQGDPRYPKELVEVMSHGSSAKLDNFTAAEVWLRGARSKISQGSGSKGQKDEMSAFVTAALAGGPMPIPFSSLVATTAATIAAERSALLGRPVSVAEILEPSSDQAQA